MSMLAPMIESRLISTSVVSRNNLVPGVGFIGRIYSAQLIYIVCLNTVRSMLRVGHVRIIDKLSRHTIHQNEIEMSVISVKK